MVYTQDLKSCDRKVVRVRVPPRAFYKLRIHFNLVPPRGVDFFIILF